MNKFRERPGAPTPEQLAAMVGHSPEGVIVSGGKLEAFREGWAKDIFGNGERAHYFVRNDLDQFVLARCGYETHVGTLYGAGNYPLCKRCLARDGA